MAQDSDSDEIAEPRRTYTAPALEKGFNVIELLADSPHGLTISEIASRLSLSISEIFRVIMVMERRAWLRKGPGDRFRVTPRVLDLAFRATPAEELSVVAAPVMHELSRRVGQSCHLVVRNEDQGLVILRQESPGPTGLSVRVGASLSLERTSSGHVLAAFASHRMPAEPEIAARLDVVRTQGYEMMDSARTRGVTDISYPVFGFDGHVAAALTVPFLELIDGTQTVGRDEARDHLARAAARISAGLGGPEAKA